MQQMLTCPKCGAQNAEGQKFCVDCGARLASGIQQQTAVCANCGLQNTAGQKYCVACGGKLSGGGQQQVSVTQQAPSAPPVTADAKLSQKYALLSITAIIFRIIGLVVLVGGILGSLALAVLAVQGAMPELMDLLDRGMEILGVVEVAGAGLAVLVFGSIVGSLLCGLGFLAFSELCNAVITIEENTGSQDLARSQ